MILYLPSENGVWGPVIGRLRLRVIPCLPLVFLVGVVQLYSLCDLVQVPVPTWPPDGRRAGHRLVHDVVVALEPLAEPGRLGNLEEEEDVHDDDGQVGDQLDQDELGPEHVVLHVGGVLSQLGGGHSGHSLRVDLKKEYLYFNIFGKETRQIASSLKYAIAIMAVHSFPTKTDIFKSHPR